MQRGTHKVNGPTRWTKCGLKKKQIKELEKTKRTKSCGGEWNIFGSPSSRFPPPHVVLLPLSPNSSEEDFWNPNMAPQLLNFDSILFPIFTLLSNQRESQRSKWRPRLRSRRSPHLTSPSSAPNPTSVRLLWDRSHVRSALSHTLAFPSASANDAGCSFCLLRPLNSKVLWSTVYVIITCSLWRDWYSLLRFSFF